MNVDKTNVCRVCGHQEDSRLEMKYHIMNDHTLQERIEGLYERKARADTSLTGK